jgi:hypothetical protein
MATSAKAVGVAIAAGAGSNDQTKAGVGDLQGKFKVTKGSFAASLNADKFWSEVSGVVEDFHCGLLYHKDNDRLYAEAKGLLKGSLCLEKGTSAEKAEVVFKGIIGIMNINRDFTYQKKKASHLKVQS